MSDATERRHPRRSTFAVLSACTRRFPPCVCFCLSRLLDRTQLIRPSTYRLTTTLLRPANLRPPPPPSTRTSKPTRFSSRHSMRPTPAFLARPVLSTEAGEVEVAGMERGVECFQRRRSESSCGFSRPVLFCERRSCDWTLSSHRRSTSPASSTARKQTTALNDKLERKREKER